MPKIHIEEVVPKASVYPIMVNFQNGYTTEEFKPKSCMLYKDKRNGERTVATKIAGLLYSGKEENDELEKTLILARNKITGKVRLIEVANAALKPIFISNVDHPTAELDTSFLEFSRKFGSKKTKQIVEQKAKLKVNIQTVTEQMHNVTVNITEEHLDLSSYIKTDSDDFYLPPIDRKAAKADDVYDLYKILSEEEYEKIFSEIESKNYMEHIPQWVQNIVGNRKLSEKHTVLLLYASTLLKLSSLVLRDINKKKFVICSVSNTLNDIVLKNFTTLVNGKRNRPIQYKDKAFCHFLVFLLLINKLKFDIDEISKNIKFSVRTLFTKCKIIGASIVTSNNRKLAQLKLPLPIVKTSRRKSAKF